MTYAVGVDFGTTNSVVAFANEKGRGPLRQPGQRRRGRPNFPHRPDVLETGAGAWPYCGAAGAGAGDKGGIGRAFHPVLQDPSGEPRFLRGAAVRRQSHYRGHGRDLPAPFVRGAGRDRNRAGIMALRGTTGGLRRRAAGRGAGLAPPVRRLCLGRPGAGGIRLRAARRGPIGTPATFKRDETVLVADFGGGTSDFALLHFTPW